MFRIIISIVLLSFAAGCAPRGDPEPNTNLTHGMVTANVVKGETNQVQIVEMFGGPNVQTTNKSGEETWLYNRISSSSTGRQENLYLFVYGSSGFSSGSHVRSFTFMITFDDTDVVKDYSIRTSQY